MAFEPKKVAAPQPPPAPKPAPPREDARPARSPLAAIRFNKNRDHGTIHPPEHGAHYEQDGLFFGAGGEMIDHPQLYTADIRAKHEMALRSRAAKAVARKAFRDAMGGEAEKLSDEDVDRLATEASSDTEEDEDAIAAAAADPKTAAQDAIVMWAKGEAKFPFFTVRQMFVTGYGVDISGAANARGWLLDNKILTDQQMKI